MNISSKLKRVKAQADHLFLRGERTDVARELRTAEYNAESLRLLCEALKTAVEKTLHLHNTPEEKRFRKVADSHGAETLKDALNQLSMSSYEQQQQQQQQMLLREVIVQAAECQQALSLEVLKYDDQILSDVLAPLTKILKEEFTNCAKLKKQLKQVGQDLDNARSRYRNSLLSGNASLAQPNTKLDNYKEEMDDAEAKLEQAKDSYACELFTLLSKEREMCELVDRFLLIQEDFFSTSHAQLNIVLPKMKQQLQFSQTGPVYACGLNQHLVLTQRSLATPIEVCIRRLVDTGLQEEGLFRIAGSASKVKRLKGAFDANLIDESTFAALGDEYHKDYDVHVIAGAFKCYLRELPEPLLTYTLHAEWLEAIRSPDRNEKLRKLWSVVKRLPKPNFENLSFVMQFLSLLSSYSAQNKMTSNNIAIVIAPNMIWAQEESKPDDVMETLGRNMSLGNLYRQIIEQLIECADYFFEEKIDFSVPKMTHGSSAHESSSNQNGNMPQPIATVAPSYVTLPRSSHRRNVSADFDKLDTSTSSINFDNKFGECESPKQPQRRKKQAPQPPQGTATRTVCDQGGQGYSSSSSPEQHRSNFMPTREAPTPSHLRSAAHSSIGVKDGQSSSHHPCGTAAQPKSIPPKESIGVATPVPATRLYHSGSIRRPNIEPPKPPLNAQNRADRYAIPQHTSSSNTTDSSSAINSNINASVGAAGTGSKPPPRPHPPNMAALEKSSSCSYVSPSATLQQSLTGSVASECSMSSSADSSSMSSADSNLGGVCAGSVTSSATTKQNKKFDVVETISVKNNTQYPTLPPPPASSHSQSVHDAPIGFEHVDSEDASPHSIPIASSNDDSDAASRPKKTMHNVSCDNIGFILDDSDEHQHTSGSNLSSSSKLFRKSLETVLQQQAAGQPVVLPKHQKQTGASSSVCGGNNSLGLQQQQVLDNEDTQTREDTNANSGDPPHEDDVKLAPPVPAIRTIREPLQQSAAAVCDRPEPAIRHDRPALPEKPSTLPRPPASEKPPLAPRPSSNPNVKQQQGLTMQHPPQLSSPVGQSSSHENLSLESSTLSSCHGNISSSSNCSNDITCNTVINNKSIGSSSNVAGDSSSTTITTAELSCTSPLDNSLVVKDAGAPVFEAPANSASPSSTPVTAASDVNASSSDNFTHPPFEASTPKSPQNVCSTGSESSSSSSPSLRTSSPTCAVGSVPDVDNRGGEEVVDATVTATAPVHAETRASQHQGNSDEERARM
uniref:Rho GTPase-activating protein 44-like n=1 Tax=Hirondellea gigas TaxID=1518452 RepID=A0A6A7G2R3_9CRUS